MNAFADIAIPAFLAGVVILLAALHEDLVRIAEALEEKPE